MNCATVHWPATCDACGAATRCSGTQAVVDGRLHWDEEHLCSRCGAMTLVCDGTLPEPLRGRILAEHGSYHVAVSDLPVRRLPALRVLRSDGSRTLPEARAMLELILGGGHHGTEPEIELLAGKLRAAGIHAVTVRSSAPPRTACPGTP
ncbi:hypothetical protein [Streptomyces sp. McG3]|uniref:hypothetical protein n=1 Tax=Streptomyces sp. McG3 TaxID=2725483 RepID=UPI001BE9075C|nr:hypothetical protein [Streptomyces sp. McG3]MBT2895426.1 hypothetical protein [Streptomyces sp. McG3]